MNVCPLPAHALAVIAEMVDDVLRNHRYEDKSYETPVGGTLDETYHNRRGGAYNDTSGRSASGVTQADVTRCRQDLFHAGVGATRATVDALLLQAIMGESIATLPVMWYTVSTGLIQAKKDLMKIQALAIASLKAIRAAGYVEYDANKAADKNGEAKPTAKGIRTFLRTIDATGIAARARGDVYEVCQIDRVKRVEIANFDVQDAEGVEKLAAGIAIKGEFAPKEPKAPKTKSAKAEAIALEVPPPAAPSPEVHLTIVMPQEKANAVVPTSMKKALKELKATAPKVPTWDGPDGSLDTSPAGLKRRYNFDGVTESLAWFIGQRAKKFDAHSDEDARALAVIEMEKAYADGTLAVNMSVHAIASRSVWADPEKRARITAAIKAGYAARKGVTA
jgi:hypothetical protein